MHTLILPETIRVINGYAFDCTKTLENLYLGAHVQKNSRQCVHFLWFDFLCCEYRRNQDGRFHFL